MSRYPWSESPAGRWGSGWASWSPPLLAYRGYRHLPVVDGDDRLVGMVTGGELIAVPNRALLGEELRG